MKNIKMILTNRYDPDMRVHKEAKYLMSKGFEVEVICWDRENEYRDKEVDIVDGVKVKRFFPYAKYGTGIKQIFSYYRFIAEIKKYLSNKDYDYLHCHDLDGVIAGYLANKKNKNLIFDMHEFYEINGKKQKFRFFIRQIVTFFQNKSSSIIYVNEVQTEQMRKKNKRKLVYLPNYPQMDQFLNANKIKSNKLRISYIGAVRQFNELKNLMDACYEIENIDINVHGGGVSYKKLKDIEPNYRNVTVTGKYNFLDSVNLYNNTDLLYAMYSNDNLQYKSSYPIKLFEAIITKTPIIVNKDTILGEFVNKYGIGFVVDGSDIKSIKELIVYIINNENVLEKKFKNLENIQFKYNWENIVKKLDSIYIK